MRVLILGWSVGRIEPPPPQKKKKLQKNLQRNHKKHWNGRPWYPRNTLKVDINIFGLKNTQFLHVFVLVFFHAVNMLIFRLKELFQVKNGSTTTLLFFFGKCQKFGSVG